MSWITELTILDWIVVIILITSVISSFRKGFAREIISLGFALAGLFMASWFYSYAGKFFLPYVKTNEIASLLGFSLIFFGMLLLGAIVSFVANKFVAAINMEWFDRLLGSAFGLIRGWVIGAIVFLMLTAFPVQIESVKNAKLAPYLLAVAHALSLVTPRPLTAKFHEGYQTIEKLWANEPGQAVEPTPAKP